MELTKRTVVVHGGREVAILIPLTGHCGIAAGQDTKGRVYMWGNGGGYQFLTECFAVAAELDRNEILYLPMHYEASEHFRETFCDCDWNFDLICVNYCETQLTPKHIDKALSVKIYSEQAVRREPAINTAYVDEWKTHRRLTVKAYKRSIYVSTNRDGFSSLAHGASLMATCDGCHEEDGLAHVHYDWSENTSASLGVTLYHWQDRAERDVEA